MALSGLTLITQNPSIRALPNNRVSSPPVTENSCGDFPELRPSAPDGVYLAQ